MSHARRGKVLFIPRARPRLLDESRAAGIRRDRRSGWILGGSLLGALALFWAGAKLSRREDSAGIRSLPGIERQSLYAHTLDELSTICRDAAATSGALRDHCLAQARFVLELPECGDACQRTATAVLPHARR